MASRQPQDVRPGFAPTHGLYPPSDPYATNNSTSTFDTMVADDPRQLSRTPSPTPSELKELKSGAIDWHSLSNWRFWFRKEWIWYYIIGTLIFVITILTTVYHKQIVHWLTPVTQWLHGLRFGWLAPIGILFIISFPPLFGHEIVAILCGVVWGLWIGFGIVAAGTFLGEIGNFYAFRYCCRSRGEKLEKTKISYACLARVVRDGGFKIALIARLSAIPGHFTTAVFSTCGMGIFVFCLAAFLSLPKQFVTVYLGVLLEQSGTGTSSQNKIVSDVVLVVTSLITFLALWYILREMNKVKPQIIYERRKARQGKLARAGEFSPYSMGELSGRSTDVFNPNGSDSDIPLAGNLEHPRYQQWDEQGRAKGYVAVPDLYTPKARSPFIVSNFPRDVEEGHGREASTDTIGWESGVGAGTPNKPNLGVQPTASKPSQEAQPLALYNPYPDHDVSHTPTQADFIDDRRGGPTGEFSGQHHQGFVEATDDTLYEHTNPRATPVQPHSQTRIPYTSPNLR